MGELYVPPVPGTEDDTYPRLVRRPTGALRPLGQRPATTGGPRPAGSVLGRIWGPRLDNATMRRVVLPAAVTGFALACIAGVTAVAGGGTDPAPGPAPSGNVAQWIAEAEQVLAANGWQATTRDTADLVIIINGESGGNPLAQNNSDSNAAAGHPSKGLMQCIDSTFAAHALPGHDDIFNPVDSIIAGVRYALGRYGSLDNVPGVASVHAGGNYVGY